MIPNPITYDTIFHTMFDTGVKVLNVPGLTEDQRIMISDIFHMRLNNMRAAYNPQPVVELESVMDEMPLPKRNTIAKITAHGCVRIGKNGWETRYKGQPAFEPVVEYDLMAMGADMLDGVGV